MELKSQFLQQTRSRLNPDLAGFPSLKDDVNPFQVGLINTSGSPLFPLVSLSEEELYILPNRTAASQDSSHLDPLPEQKTNMFFPSLVATSSSNDPSRPI